MRVRDLFLSLFLLLAMTVSSQAVVICAPIQGFAQMSREIVNPNTGHSYVLDGRGCVNANSASDLAYFAAQGILPPLEISASGGDTSGPLSGFASCDGSDETAAFIAALAGVGSGQLTVDCPIFIGDPGTVTVGSTTRLGFSGGGQIQTAFGGVTALNVITPGAYTDTCPSVTLSGNGTVGSVACQLVGITLNNTAGLGYLPGDVLSCSGGTSTSNCAVRVLTTQVATAAVRVGGSGGGTTTCQVRGTEASGLKGQVDQFLVNVTTTAGAITAVNSIVSPGNFQFEPTDLTSAAVLPLAGTGCDSLVDARLNLTTKVAVGEVQSGGSYTALPSEPMTLTGGSGSGAKLTTANWGLNSVAVSAAGAYGTAVPPTVTVNNTGQIAAAYVQPVGQSLAINGSVVAGNQQIFGGYGLIGGTPLNPEFPIHWWGAKCIGSGDDTSAIQAAVLSATKMGYGATVKLPPGRCVLTDTIRATFTGNTALTFAGAGPNTSELMQTGDADGISFIYNSGAFYTRDTTNLPGVGITFKGFGLINAGSLDTRSGIKIVGDFVNGRPNPKTLFQDIIIHTDTNNTSTHIWHIGFDILDLPNVTWERNECYGSGSHTNEVVALGTCIQIDGETGQNNTLTGATTVYFIDNLQTYFGNGINIKGFVQGVYMSNLALIHCQLCINWQSKNRQSDLHLANFYMDSYLGDVNLSQISWVQISNGTFNCVGGAAGCAGNTNLVVSCVDRASFSNGVTFAGGDIGISIRSKYCAGSNFLPSTIVGVSFTETGSAAAYPVARIVGDDTGGSPFTYIGAGLTDGGFGTIMLGDVNQTVKGVYSAAIGHHNTSVGSSSMAFGDGNIVTGNDSMAMGVGSQADGNNSFALGSFADTSHRECGVVNSSGASGFGRGLFQTTFGCVLHTRTTNDLPKILTTDGTGVPSVYNWIQGTGSNNCMNMVRNSTTNNPAREAMLVRIDVVGKDITENTKAYYSTGEVGVITQGNTGVSTYTSITSATSGKVGSGLASTVSYTIDPINFCLNVTVTPPASATDVWDWTANVHAVEAR